MDSNSPKYIDYVLYKIFYQQKKIIHKFLFIVIQVLNILVAP